jgi:hypothetical protein
MAEFITIVRNSQTAFIDLQDDEAKAQHKMSMDGSPTLALVTMVYSCLDHFQTQFVWMA